MPTSVSGADVPAVQNRPVSDHHASLNVLVRLGVGVDNDAVLEIHAGPKRDARQVAAHDHPKPEIDSRAEHHVARHDRRAGHIEVRNRLHGWAILPTLRSPFYHTKSTSETKTDWTHPGLLEQALSGEASEYLDYTTVFILNY